MNMLNSDYLTLCILSIFFSLSLPSDISEISTVFQVPETMKYFLILILKLLQTLSWSFLVFRFIIYKSNDKFMWEGNTL